jgi:hypothetical protein
MIECDWVADWVLGERSDLRIEQAIAFTKDVN